MSKRLINTFSLFNGVFGFCQWLYYLALLHSVGQSKYLLYSAVILQYTPMSLIPFLLKRRMEVSASGKWLFPISLLGIVTSLLFCTTVFFHSLPLIFISLFIMSSLSGACIGLFLTLPSKLTNNIHELKSAQSRIAMGYYLGNLLALLGVSSLSSPYRFHLLAFLAITLQIIVFFIMRTSSVKKLQVASTPSFTVIDLPSLFQEGNWVKGYLVMTFARYLSWGIISFFFPVAVIQHFSMSTNTFALVAAALMFSMMMTSFLLSFNTENANKAHYKVSAGLTNILNGVFVAAAYLAPSFTLFIVFFLLAGIVSIIADIKTSSSFIGNSTLHIRGRLSALTSSLRFAGMAIGNISSIVLVNQSWYLGPSLICLLLVTAGGSCFWILSMEKETNAIQNSKLA